MVAFLRRLSRANSVQVGPNNYTAAAASPPPALGGLPASGGIDAACLSLVPRGYTERCPFGAGGVDGHRIFAALFPLLVVSYLLFVSLVCYLLVPILQYLFAKDKE